MDSPLQADLGYCLSSKVLGLELEGDWGDDLTLAVNAFKQSSFLGLKDIALTSCLRRAGYFGFALIVIMEKVCVFILKYIPAILFFQ